MGTHTEKPNKAR